MSDVALEARGLKKSFGPVEALRGVDLTVRRGDLYGFLGQNGAGKTTAIKVLARLIRPTGGAAAILGRDVVSSDPACLFAGVGFLVESPAFFPYLTGRGNLALHARLAGLAERRGAVQRALELLGLGRFADRRVAEYSLGMKQRLGLAQALLGAPEVLVLDEPTNGLDPGGIAQVREILRAESERHGRTVFLSSHILSEVEALCNRVAVIDQGVIVAEGEVSRLLREGETLCIRTSDAARARAAAGLPESAVEGDVLRVHGGDEEAARLVRLLVEAGVAVYEVTRARRSLEDVYHDLTGAGAAWRRS
ncbi:MAG: ABC transporter ATP-binding protein [Planctomycetes bacterium]|nr:ABC transporter ATP-binding protein [Planctomycetota bacterium]